ncbi:MAG: metallophosphoesterase [Sandaracinaceae bacterium]|nr:metallophosphoesterase [Sandaracinaceae bacterium]
MRSLTEMLVFFSVASTGWALVHFGLYRGLRHAFPEKKRKPFIAALFVGFSLAPLSMLLARTSVATRVVETFSRIAFIEAGFVSLIFILLVLRWLGSLLARPFASKVKTARRDFLRRASDLAIALTALVIGGTGIATAMREPQIIRVPIRLPRLGEPFRGYRIVQLSDFHIGPAFREEGVRLVVDKVNALKPDLVVITGDLIDGYVHELRPHVAPLADLKARDGVYFATGNHEYYWGGEEWIRHLEELGIPTLRNEARLIERDGDGLIIAGCTDYRMGRSIKGDASDPQKALEGLPRALPRILLAHQPQSVYQAAEAGYDLQLSGHTHGGQFFPFTWLIHLVQPFVAGLDRHGDTQLYVNRGTGFWGPAMRHGGEGEITEILLDKLEEEAVVRSEGLEEDASPGPNLRPESVRAHAMKEV